VRQYSQYFDGYEDAQVGGGSIWLDGQVKREDFMLKDTRSDPPALSFVGSVPYVVWLVRARKDESDAPVVVHLVQWDPPPKGPYYYKDPNYPPPSDPNQPFTVELKLDRFFGDPPSKVRLLRPGIAEEVLSPQPNAAQGTMRVNVPALEPWGVLVVEPPLRAAPQ